MSYPVLTEHQLKTLVGIRNHIANMAMQGFVYPNWSDEFTREDFNRTVENLKSSDYKFNISDLDHEQADALGFGRWDDELNMRLFPLWIAPFLANGTRCATIPIGDDPSEEFDYHVDMTDLDHRFGALAFGPARRRRSLRWRKGDAMTGLYKVVRCSNLDDPAYVEKALSLTEYTCGMTRSAVWFMSGDAAEQIAYELNELEDGSGPHFWRAKPAGYVTHGGMEP